MKTTTCEQLLSMETIGAAFKNKQHKLSEQIISCFFTCYQPLFMQWAKIAYRHIPSDVVEFAAMNAFSDGVLKLKESAIRDELYQSNASVKTVLFSFCRFTLLAHLKNEERLAEKNKKLVHHFSEVSHNDLDTEFEGKERKHEVIKKALEKMPLADRQIIQWRHIDEKSNDEIATVLAITVASATNRIYRCMKRLRELVEEMEKDD